MSTTNTERDPQFSFRIEPRLLQALKIEAVKDGVSFQEWLTRLVVKELKRRGVNVR